MKTLFYSYKPFEKPYLETANTNGYEVAVTAASLSLQTVQKSTGFDAISVFTGDDVSAPVLEALHRNGIQYIAVRAAGYDNVDIAKAAALHIKVANVPAYSPYAIAEHALTLMLALNRKLLLGSKLVQRHDFRVDELVGFDLHGKTFGIIGTGKIGATLVQILHGFGCRLLGYDISENHTLTEKYDLEYVPLPQLCHEADVISIHTSLTPETRYLINKKLISLMKKGVMLINTGRGGCVNTMDVIEFLKNGHIGYYGADVYEKEKGIFFHDWSGKDLHDELLRQLLVMPNVIITPHQAFATAEALTNIAASTFYNIDCWARQRHSENELTPAADIRIAKVNIL